MNGNGELQTMTSCINELNLLPTGDFKCATNHYTKCAILNAFVQLWNQLVEYRLRPLVSYDCLACGTWLSNAQKDVYMSVNYELAFYVPLFSELEA